MSSLLLLTAHLSIYPALAALRQSLTVPTDHFSFELTRSELQDLVPGSLQLRGVGVRQATESATGGLESEVGRILDIPGKHGPQAVKLIRLSGQGEVWVQNLVQGVYQKIPSSELEFPILPPERLERIAFVLSRPGPATLNYQTTAVSWSVAYLFQKQAGGLGTITAQAEIKNRLNRAWNVTSAELITQNPGQFQLAAGPSFNRIALASQPPTPLAESVVAGAHRYRIDGPLRLPAAATVTIPFFKVSSAMRHFLELTAPFEPASSHGALESVFRIRPKRFLPAGRVALTDSGVLLGIQAIPNEAAGQPFQIDLGPDPSATYTQTVRLLQKTSTAEVFAESWRIENHSSHPIDIRIRQDLQASEVAVGQRSGQPIAISGTIPAEGSLARTYLIDLVLGSSHP